MLSQISSKSNCTAFGLEGHNGKQNLAIMHLRTYLWSMWTMERLTIIISNWITGIQGPVYRESLDKKPHFFYPVLSRVFH